MDTQHDGSGEKSTLRLDSRFNRTCVHFSAVTPTPPGHRDVPRISITSKLQYMKYTDSTETKEAVKKIQSGQLYPGKKKAFLHDEYGH